MTENSTAAGAGTALTAFDTGERLEPVVWPQKPGNTGDCGKVDFDTDEGSTALTLHATRNDDGDSYTLHVGNVSVDLAVVGDDSAPKMEVPSKILQEKVGEAIAELRTSYEQEVAEVYWNHRQAVIVVPGEKHVRKQQMIIVADDGFTMSAKAGSWHNGVRDTRID
ncbi:UNVERIFIED_ORG: hypothetical protein ABIB52_000784 [Arthrobacter sp. UYCu721]